MVMTAVRDAVAGRGAGCVDVDVDVQAPATAAVATASATDRDGADRLAIAGHVTGGCAQPWGAQRRVRR